MENQLLVRRLGRQDYTPVWLAIHQFTDHRDSTTRDEVWLVEHNPCLLKDKLAKLSIFLILEIFLLYKVIGVGKSPTTDRGN